MIGGVTCHVSPDLPGVPHLQVTRLGWVKKQPYFTCNLTTPPSRGALSQDYWMVAKHVNEKNAGKPRVLDWCPSTLTCCSCLLVWQTGLPTLAGHPTYHVNVIKLKWEIIWTGGLPHLSGLPHLPGVFHLHVNRLLTYCSFIILFDVTAVVVS